MIHIQRIHSCTLEDNIGASLKISNHDSLELQTLQHTDYTRQDVERNNDPENNFNASRNNNCHYNTDKQYNKDGKLSVIHLKVEAFMQSLTTLSATNVISLNHSVSLQYQRPG